MRVKAYQLCFSWSQLRSQQLPVLALHELPDLLQPRPHSVLGLPPQRPDLSIRGDIKAAAKVNKGTAEVG